MLSDEVLDKVVERLVNRMEEANLYTLKSIGKTIKKIGTINPSDVHQLVEAMQYGADYDKIVKKLAEITDLNVRDIYEIFDEVAKTDSRFAEQFYVYRGKRYIPYKENINLQRQVRLLADMTAETYRNFSNSTVVGFRIRDKDGKVIHKGLKETYQDVVDRAVMAISQGKSTYEGEIYKIMKELGKSGLSSVDYESGRSRRMDSALRMNVKGALRDLHTRTQEELGKEFGADGWEISVHGHPAPDHEDAQGRQFSNDEFKKLQEDGVAKTYDGISINMKRGIHHRPIGQLNCYHYPFSIILGVNKPQYSNEQLQKIKDDNDKGFDFEGKHYTLYEGTQLQRKIETEIRRQKDLQILGRAGGSDELSNEAQKNINLLTKKYQELSNVSGLPTKLERLRVDGYKEIKLVDNTEAKDKINGSKSILQEEKPKKKAEKVEKPTIPIKDGKFYDTSKVFKNSKQYLDLSNDDNIKIYNGTDNLKITIYERANIKRANYNRSYKKITTTGWKDDDVRPATVLWHEMGHALDNSKGGPLGTNYLSNSLEMRRAMYDYYSNNRTIPDRVKEYFEGFKERAGKEWEKEHDYKSFYKNYIEFRKSEGASEWSISVLEDMKKNKLDEYKEEIKRDYEWQKKRNYFNKKKTDIEYAQLLNFSDMFSAISSGEYNRDFCSNYGYHPKSYFNRKAENPTTELFANFVSLKMTGANEHLEFFKKECPEIYKELDKLYKEIGDDLNAR